MGNGKPLQAAKNYQVDHAKVKEITEIRRMEQEQMRAYIRHTGCLMEFLGRALDDPTAGPCGKCAGCQGKPLISTTLDETLANQAAIFLRRAYQPIPRRNDGPAEIRFQNMDSKSGRSTRKSWPPRPGAMCVAGCGMGTDSRCGKVREGTVRR